MASTAATLLGLSLLLSLSGVSLSLALSSAVLDAAEILGAAGFQTMAMNMELASQALQTHSLTIFAPTDFAFTQIPHIPLSLLRYHLLPHTFSLHSLTSLPFGASIPTLLPSHSLTITTTPNRFSINNVTVNPSPLFHSRHVIIFATESFFDPYFQLPAKTPATCLPSETSSPDVASREASRALASRGFSLTASLLRLQFPAADRRQTTLFAPADHAVSDNLTSYSAVLRRHLVPCRISWTDLLALEDGTLIGTYERGLALNVTKSGINGTVLLNGVPVISPEIYTSDWLVVHGLQQVLSVRKGKHHHRTEAREYSDPVSVSAQETQGDDSSSSSSSAVFGSLDGVEDAVPHYHFSVFH